ncbi:ATP-binding protein [Actinotignum sp. GS-2025b]|uniref:ATP-binding protein n=1 Tax=Actinotignum sp. GS-2025b TaxID=3427275 RepID=UPI003F461EB8
MDTEAVAGIPYLPRALDRLVTRALASSGALVIEGPRGCGKTMTALHHCESAVFLDTPQAQQLAQIAPDALLEGGRPRLLDEWQLNPDLWNMVRRAVDSSPGFGDFILTGSSVPAGDITRHTGAGRFTRVRQRTMTWQEKGRSSGAVSLEKLLAGEPVSTNLSTPPLDSVIEALLRPGFPGMLDLEGEAAFFALTSYLQEIARADIPRIITLRQDPQLILHLLRTLARSVATEVSIATLKKDLDAVFPASSRQTVSTLLDTLQRLFVVEAVPAWSVRLRSKAQLRLSPKYHLADPALACAALAADSSALQRDLETLGFIFESAVVHDLSVFAETLGGHVRHYRDSYGHEIDAVLEFPGGVWAGIKVKLGGGQITQGAHGLKKAVDQIAPERGEPAFLAVITGTGITGPAAEGVITFPLSALGQ